MGTNRGGFPLPSLRLGSLVPTFRDKFFGTLFTGMATAVLTVAATTLTPVGEGLREWASPTSATLTGTLVFGGVPITGADLVLDDSAHTKTYSKGEYTFTDVEKGVHHLKYVRDDATLYELEVVVHKRSTVVEMGQTDIAFASPMLTASTGEVAVLLTPTPEAGLQPPPVDRTATPTVAARAATVVADLTWVPTFSSIFPQLPEFTIDLPSLALLTPTPAPVANGTPAAGNVDGGPSGDLALRVGSLDQANAGRVAQVVLVGEPDALAEVDRVTYTLPEGFNPSVVSRFSPVDGFALTFVPDAVSTISVKATVYFRDGRSFELSTEIAPA